MSPARGETLRELATYLVQSGHEATMRDFFEQRIGSRREEALAGVRHLRGRERLNEVARVFSELGFMAVVEDHGGECRLRLCQCPIRDLIHSTGFPAWPNPGFSRNCSASRRLE